MKTISNKKLTEMIVIGAALTALVLVLQCTIAKAIHFGTFSVTLVLIPIAIGAATYGKYMGAWLGFVFGLAVLISGDAALFMGIDPFGTIVTVMLKGTLCGFFAGLAYELVAKKNELLATFVAAIVCPVVNTGVFLLGCSVFFLDFVKQNANGQNAFVFMLVAFVGFNFLFELAVNLVLSPAVSRVIKVITKKAY